MFWAMPRRIRLDIEERKAVCKVTGIETDKAVSTFRTQNYGGNYSGTWSHPLTPYKWDPKKPNEEHLSAKGQPGGITYKFWDQLTFSSDVDGQRCAAVVQHYYDIFDMFATQHNQVPSLWIFGYDMDNMKARGWYSSHLPLFDIQIQYQDQALRQIKQLQTLSTNILWHCRTQIKAAWFDKPADAKGDMSFVDMAYWQRSHNIFFNTVASLLENSKGQICVLNPEQAKEWLTSIRNLCIDLFDEFALSELGNQKSMSKRIKARQQLTDWLFGSKEIKAFIVNHNIEFTKEVA
jgi:CRISPR system Cascade subunit CasA